MAETHEMLLTGRVASGEERWLCTSCARETLVTWSPRFRSTALVEGDQHAAHAGGKGGATMSTVSVHQAPSGMARAWLRTSGIDWDGLAGPEARSA